MPITERLIGNVCNVLGEKASLENRRNNCRGSKPIGKYPQYHDHFNYCQVVGARTPAILRRSPD
jgi:hypothetical protein